MVATLPSNIANALSTANGATSVAPALTSTAVGSLLVLFVACVGTGTPTVTSVTGGGTWVQAQHTAISTTQFTDIWIQFNNPGGVTTITANLGGTVQGVSATAMEILGAGTSGTIEFAAGQSNAASTAVPEQCTSRPLNSQEINLFCIGYTAPTTFLTLTTRAIDWNWNPATGSLSDVVSTGGTNNSELRTYVASNGPDIPFIRGTLGASSSWATAYVRLLIAATQGLNVTPAGGPIGIYTPQFNQGMIGG